MPHKNGREFHSVKAPAERRRYSIAAVDRTIAVLDAVASGNGVSLAEVARRSGLDEATALRYLSSLCGHEFVVRDESTGRYSLGLRLYRLGQQAVGLRDVRKVALPHMERLLERFEETVNLAQWRGDVLVVIDVLESTRSIRRGASIGDADFWHASALGKSILACLPEAEATRLLEKTERVRFTEHTLVEIDDLLASLDAVGRRGYALDDGEYEEGLRCVAAAVRDRHGRPTYAISISGVAARMPEQSTKEIGKAVIDAAEAISHALGYMPHEEEEEA